MLSTPHRHTIHPVQPGRQMGVGPMAGNASSSIQVGLDAVIERWPDRDGLESRPIPWGLQWQVSPVWDGVA